MRGAVMGGAAPLPSHTLTRRGRTLEVRAGGRVVGMWTDDSATGPGVFMWRAGAGWSREMVERAAGAAAGTVDGGQGDGRLGEAPQRDRGGGARCGTCLRYTDLEEDWGYCPHSPNRIAHPEGRACVAYARRG